MKTNRQNNDNDPLNELLREWSVTSPLPPRFHDAVWAKIARQEERREPFWAALTDWLQTLVPRPAVALCYATALLFIGIAGGWWTGGIKSARMSSTLESRYVQSVDPYKATATNP